MHLTRKDPRWRKRVEEYGYRCAYCTKKRSFALLTIDHILPRSLGGTYATANLVPACAKCNEARGNDISIMPYDVAALKTLVMARGEVW